MSLSIFEKWSTIEVSIPFNIEQRNRKLANFILTETEESPNFDANGLTLEKSKQCYKIVYKNYWKFNDYLVSTLKR
jgi:hypothetical protein